jgi:hypothetical protein
MLPWKFEAVINVALLGLALWVRRRHRPGRALGWLAIVYAVLLVVSSFVGVVVGVIVEMDPFAGETFDPPQGALTALGIPESVSCAVTGVVTFLLPTIAALVMFRRSHHDSYPIGPRPCLRVDDAQQPDEPDGPAAAL